MASLQELLGTTVVQGLIVTEVVECPNLREKKAPARASAHSEADLERALWFLYQQWNLLGFKPRTFYQMFTRSHKHYRGGIAAVQTILSDGAASGFEFLNHRGKRQLSIESLVLREAWSHLFNDRDKRIAQQRLDGIAK